MLIKESTLRRIIREEARRALREDEAAVPPPTPPPFTLNSDGSIKVNIKRPPGYVNPNAPVVPLTIEEAPQAAYKKINSDFKKIMIVAWDRYALNVAQGQTSVLNFQFQINTDGSVAPNTIKVTCTPDFTSMDKERTLSGDFKKAIAGWKFAPVAEAFIYQHPIGMEFSSKEY